MGKTAMEKQEQLIGQFMRTAKWAHKSTVKSAVQTTIERSAEQRKKFEKKNANREVTAYGPGGVPYYGISQEQADAIREKTLLEIQNREANKKAQRKAKAAAAKAKRIQAALDAEAEKERAFKAMIAKKAQEQIAARNK